jgi:hypothetical protein
LTAGLVYSSISKHGSPRNELWITGHIHRACHDCVAK